MRLWGFCAWSLDELFNIFVTKIKLENKLFPTGDKADATLKEQLFNYLKME
jgi:hypothetical protein